MHKLTSSWEIEVKKNLIYFQIIDENIGCFTLQLSISFALLLQLKTFKRKMSHSMDHWSYSHICLEYWFWIHYHRIRTPHIYLQYILSPGKLYNTFCKDDQSINICIFKKYTLNSLPALNTGSLESNMQLIRLLPLTLYLSSPIWTYSYLHVHSVPCSRTHCKTKHCPWLLGSCTNISTGVSGLTQILQILGRGWSCSYRLHTAWKQC